jgi:hypothetical protein
MRWGRFGFLYATGLISFLGNLCCSTIRDNTCGFHFDQTVAAQLHHVRTLFQPADSVQQAKLIIQKFQRNPENVGCCGKVILVNCQQGFLCVEEVFCSKEICFVFFSGKFTCIPPVRKRLIRKERFTLLAPGDFRQYGPCDFDQNPAG